MKKKYTIHVLQTAGACFQMISMVTMYSMYSRVHFPPYQRCTNFENFLPIICRDISYFCEFRFSLCAKMASYAI